MPEEKKNMIRVIPTEVYSRIVGYYRPVVAWNTGKQQEFKERNGFDKALV
jgi:anaerobic ribonucleoside-triphosphate reductase